MGRIDSWLEGLLHGSGLGAILLVSLALGLRHASDPDHLAAVTTLIASEKARRRASRAGFMGVCWGLGHGTMLILLGLPLVLLGLHLPAAVQRASEAALGGIIVFLAIRLLARWRRGLFHTHSHRHGEHVHRHVHSHSGASSHAHSHASPLRTPLASYGVGLVHGIGGSGGLTLLLLSTISDKTEAAAALLLFAAGTTVSMALLSTAFGLAIAGGPMGRRFESAAPVLACLSMTFGTWYALGALGLVAYPL